MSPEPAVDGISAEEWRGLLRTMRGMVYRTMGVTKDWRQLAEASPYYESGVVDYALWIHLAFAVPTPLLWIFVIVQALRRFPKPANASEYSARHILWGRVAAGAMLLTAATGWAFYWLAFVM